jgi:hypothetical protein
MSLAEDHRFAGTRAGATFGVPIDQISFNDSVRSGGLDDAHITLLMETDGNWPPVVVWGKKNVVIDGAHRVAAARRLQHTRVETVRFVGTVEDAYLESLRLNLEHGLPLSLDDRRRGALRVLRLHPEWSDRRIGSLCGLCGKTVRGLRPESVDALQRRVGKDGKARPIEAGQVRENIRQALKDNPTASLRSVAAAAGASPETVRAVRAGLRETLEREPGITTTLKSVPSPKAARPQKQWEADLALASSGDAGDFARWLDQTQVDDEWREYVWTIPVGRIYEVADEARRRASCWIRLANVLESRIQR